MEQFIEWAKGDGLVYLIIFASVLPLLYIFRSWTWPVIAYTLELVIYTVALHVFFHYFLLVATWFRGATSIRVLADGTTVTPPPMETPLFEFWRRELYSPEAVYYLEIGCFFALIYVVWRFRPMSLEKVNTYKGKNSGRAKKKRNLGSVNSNLAHRPRFARKKR